MAFIHPDFLLATGSARHLYHSFAEGEPILDYHNHLPPQELAGNRQFANLFDAWLEGDHYKWRAMRANGVAEKYCTGRDVSRGSIYITLDRLETKGYLRSRLADPTPERGGRAKRYYALRPRAVDALKESRRALVALWRGLESALGQG